MIVLEFFLPLGGTYFPFTVLFSHMDSIFKNSMFVKTVQKRASSFCPGNFPLLLPKLQVSDKCTPREGAEGSGAPEGNLVAMLTSEEAGVDMLLPWSGQVQSIQSCGEGKGEQSCWTSLWRGLTCTPASQGLICCWVPEKGNMANASAWPTWDSTATVHLICQSQRKEMFLFPLQSILQQPQPRVRPLVSLMWDHTVTQGKTVPASRGTSWMETGRKKKSHKEALFFPLHTSSDH